MSFEDEQRWLAVLERRRSADGAFVYAVKTTGVFCRPSCASRRALRKNVRFFESPGQAVEAGYRACLKCAPGGEASAAQAKLLDACRLLEGEAGSGTREVALAIGLSEAHFVRAFKQLTGVTPQAYRRRVLAERARAALAGAPSVTDTVYEAGYSTSSRFYASVGQELGMSARQLRAGAAELEVSYVLRPCSLGVLLVAWTARGVCDVAFGDDEATVAAALRQRFPRASLERQEVPPWVDALVAGVERPRQLFVPLDVAGTAFQQRVWAALRQIPLGETRSYRELAAALGAPTGARAVAQACASNHLAMLIPCHRVVRADGELAGYRWGVERKRALLEREQEEVGEEPEQ
jgi:AraC family transcriptional regulator of adaptative response/methylated-DNA-[protein]-cysteine methyltransferase